MTGPDPARLLDSAAFGAVFDDAQHSVFRLETLQTYAVPADDDELIAFRTGAPRPERSVRTSPWMRRIAVQTAAGVAWSRLRVVAFPLSEYTRFELVAFVESQAVGEEIRLVGQPVDEGDFWLIDAGTDTQIAVLMHYDVAGQVVGRERINDPARIGELAAVRAEAWPVGMPLNVWLAEQGSGV